MSPNGIGCRAGGLTGGLGTTDFRGVINPCGRVLSMHVCIYSGRIFRSFKKCRRYPWLKKKKKKKRLKSSKTGNFLPLMKMVPSVMLTG
jgi:hypothetical protein